jgi:hypothetical protein
MKTVLISHFMHFSRMIVPTVTMSRPEPWVINQTQRLTIFFTNRLQALVRLSLTVVDQDSPLSFASSASASNSTDVPSTALTTVVRQSAFTLNFPDVVD